MLEQTGDIEGIGFSTEGIEQAYGILEDAVKNGVLMGAALQVSREGVVLSPACFGRRGMDEDSPLVEKDTIFQVASITKPVVAAAAMLLVERGRVCLDDHVVDFVPEFGQKGKEVVKVRHLLTHTSGLPDQLPENQAFREQQLPLKTFVNRICESPLYFKPGTSIAYQSCGFAMLGEIVERLEGMELQMFLREEFFDILKLTDTSLGVQEEQLDRVSEVKLPTRNWDGSYSATPGGQDSEWNWNSIYWMNFRAPWGGMFTTVEEITVICNMFLNMGRGGDLRVLASATVAAMTADQTSKMPNLQQQDRFSQRWGLGWKLQDRVSSLFGNLTSLTTYGHEGATGTVVWVDPQSKVTFALFTNDPSGAKNIRPKVSNAVMGAVL